MQKVNKYVTVHSVFVQVVGVGAFVGTSGAV